MKVVNARRNDGDETANKPPGYGVVHLGQWDLHGDQASLASVHWSFESAIDVAARQELKGQPCVVMCFDEMRDVSSSSAC
jgi:hypothetical protein